MFGHLDRTCRNSLNLLEAELMKITAVKHFALHANFRNVFLVKIETDAGIYAKSLDTPVYQLLGGRSRDWVPCFTDGGMLNSDACVEKAQQLVAEGWEFLRFLPGMPGMTSALDDADYPFEMWETPRYDRPDGAFTNW